MKMIHYEGFGVTVHHGDCMDVMRDLPDASVDAVVTDPPYDLTAGKKGGSGVASVNLDSPYGRARIGTGNGSGGFMGQCLHPATDLLTRTGWRPVGKVMEGDEVCALDPITGEIEYIEVLATHEYDFDGELLQVGGRSARQVVTPNHKVWTDRGLVRADALLAKFRLSNQGTWLGSPAKDFTVAGKDFSVVPLLRFLGLWLGDGYVARRKAQPHKQDFVGFSVKKERKVEAIRAACKALGVRFTETSGSDGFTAFYVYDKALLGWLSPLGKASEKYIPNDLFDLSPALLEHLYTGLMDTDGHVQRGQHVFYTSSERLKDDFQRLCLHTGRSATARFREGRQSAIAGYQVEGNGAWTCSVLPRGKRGTWLERDGRINRPQPPGVQPFSYKGSVHCVTLARHHVMMSRFDGTMVWTGNSWDSTGIAFTIELWAECLRVLKPGGHILAFGSTRTWHRMVCAIEDAGFEIRDSISWIYSQGFPKSVDVAKAIDRAAGAERQIVSQGPPVKRLIPGADQNRTGSWIKDNGREYTPTVTEPATDDAQKWQGWHTALKPAHELIILARKPMIGSTVANVLAHGTGALNIDATRTPHVTVGGGNLADNPHLRTTIGGGNGGKIIRSELDRREVIPHEGGRWPTNVIFDEVAAADLDERVEGDEGPSRYFPMMDTPDIDRTYYSPKAGGSERLSVNGVSHITVKPLDLMKWLVRLVTPPGGTVLEPFAGSGTTAEACVVEGFNCIAIEREADYLPLIVGRITRQRDPVAHVRLVGDENPTLFD